MMIFRWLAALQMLWASPALAHLTPNSVIALDFADGQVWATITIPANELSYAYGKPSLSAAELLRHIRVASDSGQPWRVGVESIRYDTLQRQTDFIARVRLTPPRGAPARRFSLGYDAVIDRVSSHVVLVNAASDFSGGVLQSEPAILGGLQQGSATMEIDRGPGSNWRGLLAAIRLGMRHIAAGIDHLLFLFSLLLPAPLMATGGRWREAGSTRATLRRLIGIVTAFTIGHSVTLIGGAFFGWRLPSQPVEVGIAVSILISAIHAFRPIFPGREAWIAGGFGLIHGMAFATVVGDFALEPLAKAQAILGFNLGIELVQVGLCVIVVPLLIFLAKRPVYGWLRPAGALITGAAAMYWIWDRI